MSKRLVIGNWKQNPATADEAKEISRKTRSAAARLAKTDVVVCPPFPFIQAASSSRPSANLSMGAQSVSVDDGGAHTGEVSASMLRSLGVEYVIAGHSEQRAAGDSDETVSKRIAMILESGMMAVVCVGEKARDESGAHFDFIKNEIKGTFAGIPADKAKKVILAYEPIWAIGAKDAMAPADIHEMSIFVRKAFADVFGSEAAMKVKVLYGGSVNFRNAADIMRMGQVNGLLVGRESINAPGFVELLKAVDAA